jgi:flagellar biosynthesis protein FlhG
MADQASTLRRLMLQKNAVEGGVDPIRVASTRLRQPSAPRQSRVISVASGKGGVGKSCLVATLGTWLARRGQRVLMIDGDFGLANLEILLNVQASATLEEVMRGDATIADAIIGVEPNLWLIPSASGLMAYREADLPTRQKIVTLLNDLPWSMDTVLIDGGAGVGDAVLNLHGMGHQSLVVVTPDPTSISDAYALIKQLRTRVGVSQIGVVVNFVTDGREAQGVFKHLQEVTTRFLDVRLEFVGHWERDEKVSQSVLRRKILLDLDSKARSIPSLNLLGKRIEERPANSAEFWKTLFYEVRA